MNASHTSSAIKAYDRGIEVAEAYLKVSRMEPTKKCDICGLNLDGAETHRSTSSIGKNTLLCPRCQEDILASNRVLSEPSRKYTERLPVTSELSLAD